MNKYFSYEGCEGEFSVHSTLDEAKAAAIEEADRSYHFGGEWNGSFSDELQDGIRRTCFGMILGDFNVPTRPLTEEEQEEYGDEFSYMVEPPQLVEYQQNNGWIKCQDKLPERAQRVLVLDNEMSCYFAMLKFDGARKYWELERYDQNIGYGVNVEFDEILYWRPELDLPQD